jgi:hypothetical protein
MASEEDRPIIVSGGEKMVTVELPTSTKPNHGPHAVKALAEGGPFKRIVFTDTTNHVEFSTPAAGNWTIRIE